MGEARHHMDGLATTEIDYGLISPNPWNPNKQSDRAFQAEVESISTHGFIDPILIRKLGKGYQIIDGEHRWRAFGQVVTEGVAAAGNLQRLIASNVIPAIVLDVTEAEAKKLTIIMNETRGAANVTDLSYLLADLLPHYGAELITGLPYTPEQLSGYLALTEFDTSDYEMPADSAAFDHKPTPFTVTAILDESAEEDWRDLSSELADLPSDSKLRAGRIITHLLTFRKAQK